MQNHDASSAGGTPADDWDILSNETGDASADGLPETDSAPKSPAPAPASPAGRASVLDVSAVRGARPGHPLYMLSAACMLLGCFVVQAALRGQGTQGVFGLSLTLVGYELLIAGVAWVLLRLNFWRNLMQLLALAVLFFADPTFTYFRLVITDAGVGIGLTVGVVLLALGKLAVLRSASPDLASALTWRAVGLAGVGFAINLAVPYLPALYSATYKGWTTPGLYLAYWLAAAALALALPRLLSLLRGGETAGAESPAQVAATARTTGLDRVAFHRDRAARRWLQFIVLLPLSTLLLRLIFLHWLYNEPLRTELIAPLFLACAVRADHFFRDRAPMRAAFLRFALLTVAVLLSQKAIVHAQYPEPLFTPWRVTLMVSALMLGWETGRRRSWFHGVVAVSAALLAVVTAGPETLAQSFIGARRWSVDYLIPTTSMGWGMLAIATAFFLMLAGLGWSLLQARKERSPSAVHE